MIFPPARYVKELGFQLSLGATLPEYDIARVGTAYRLLAKKSLNDSAMMSTCIRQRDEFIIQGDLGSPGGFH